MATVSFFSDHNFGGDSFTYSTNNGMEASFSDKTDWDSIKTGNNSYLTVYDGAGFTGNVLKLGPNGTLSDLNKVERGQDGDWKNQIQSFQLSSTQG